MKAHRAILSRANCNHIHIYAREHILYVVQTQHLLLLLFFRSFSLVSAHRQPISWRYLRITSVYDTIHSLRSDFMNETRRDNHRHVK